LRREVVVQLVWDFAAVVRREEPPGARGLGGVEAGGDGEAAAEGDAAGEASEASEIGASGDEGRWETGSGLREDGHWLGIEGLGFGREW